MLFVQSQASWSFWDETATVSTLGLVHAWQGRADTGTKISERSCSEYLPYLSVKFLNVVWLFSTSTPRHHISRSYTCTVPTMITATKID